MYMVRFLHCLDGQYRSWLLDMEMQLLSPLWACLIWKIRSKLHQHEWHQDPPTVSMETVEHAPLKDFLGRGVVTIQHLTIFTKHRTAMEMEMNSLYLDISRSVFLSIKTWPYVFALWDFVAICVSYRVADTSAPTPQIWAILTVFRR